MPKKSQQNLDRPANAPGLLAVVCLVFGVAGCGNPPSRLPTTDLGVCGTSHRLVLIPAGEATLGSREAPDTGMEPRRVEVGAFWLSDREVTVAQYAAFLKETGGEPMSDSEQFGLDRVPDASLGNHPAAWVSAADAEAYCRWVSEQTGWSVRLPTEDEWEYAARGGIRRARYPWGWGDPEGRCCFAAASCVPVASYDPNPFGLYDMAGGVFEWCAGDAGEESRVARGGSWAERNPRMICVYTRTSFAKDYRDADVGFRIAATPTGDQQLAE